MAYRMKPDLLAQKRRRELKELKHARRYPKPSFMARMAAAVAAATNRKAL